MKSWTRWLGWLGLFGLGMLFLLVSRLPGEPEAEPPLLETRLLMGTLVSISTWGVEEKQAEAAMEQAFAEMSRIEGMMSRFIPTSPVSGLNDAPRGAFHTVPAELISVVSKGLEIGQLSGGAFDIGLGPLSDLWGFSREPPPETPPAPDALKKWREERDRTPGPGIELASDNRLRLTGPAIGLDLGGIAKGYAVERAMEMLRQAGVVNALINAGGDMRIAGSKGGKPWHIGLRDPRKPDGVVAVMDLTGSKALATSGDYERFFMADGVRYHHILDPKQGGSSRSGLMAVSIQAADSLTADALSTAVFVLGESAGLALLQQFPGCEALLIREDGQMVQTPGFVATRSKTP